MIRGYRILRWQTKETKEVGCMWLPMGVYDKYASFITTIDFTDSNVNRTFNNLENQNMYLKVSFLELKLSIFLKRLHQ